MSICFEHYKAIITSIMILGDADKNRYT